MTESKIHNSFKDQIFDKAVELYSEHFDRYGKYDRHRPGAFVESQIFMDNILDNDIVHAEQDKGIEFEAIKSQIKEWIYSGEMEQYIYNEFDASEQPEWERVGCPRIYTY